MTQMLQSARAALFPLCLACGLATGLSLGPTMAVAADPLPAPQGEVLLSVTGHITQTNSGAAALFDLAMLEALPSRQIMTTTIWTAGEQSFTGVAVADLIAALGASGTTMRATAVNDYAVDIPAADWVPGGAMIAYRNNDAPMTLRDKGPLWLVYPYDDNPAYQSEVIYSRSIWQLDRLDIE